MLKILTRKNGLYDYVIIKKSYSNSTSELIDTKLANLKSHLSATSTISKNLFLTIIKLVETSNTCTSKTALSLLKYCSIHLVDIVPDKRQKWLDYLFATLLQTKMAKASLEYKVEHYDVYMKNTLANEGSFCPFEISRQMNKNQVCANSSVNLSFVRQLCQIDEIATALVHVNNVLKMKKASTLFDLNTYTKVLDFEKFMNEMPNSFMGNEEESTNLINPIIGFYASKNERDGENAIRLFRYLYEMDLKPNNCTYVNLIGGYFQMRRFEDAKKLLEKTLDNLKLPDVFDLYLALSKVKTPSTDSNYDDIENILLSRIPKNFDAKNDRILFIHAISRLCKYGNYETAFQLTQTFFLPHFTEDDPIEKDIIRLNLNMANYFFQSLAEYSSNVDVILNYTRQAAKFESQLDEGKHLKRTLYYSLLAQNPNEISLSLINELKRRAFDMKLNYFMPLIAEQAKRLEKANSLESELIFMRLRELIHAIKYDFGLNIGQLALNQILSILRFDENQTPRSNVTYTMLARLFSMNDFSYSVVFQSCAYKILNYRSKFLQEENFRLSVDDVREDFNDLIGLLEVLKVKEIDPPILDKLDRYVTVLIKQKRFKLTDLGNLDQNLVLKAIGMLNVIVKSQSLENLNKRLSEHLGNNGSTENTITTTTKTTRSITSKEKYRDTASFDMLELEISECEKSGEDASDLIIRLIYKICQDPRLVSTPVEYLNNLESKLSPIRFDARLNQELMFFYSTKCPTTNENKATFYFENFKKQLNTSNNQYRPDPYIILAYVEFLLATSKNSANCSRQIVDVFKQIRFPARRHDDEKILIQHLTTRVYPKLTNKVFEELIVAICESGFLGGRGDNLDLVSLALIKHVEAKKIEDAFGFYERCGLKDYERNDDRIHLFKLLLLQLLFKKRSQNAITHYKMQQLMKTISSKRKSGDNLVMDNGGDDEVLMADHLRLLAHVLNADYEKAFEVFSKSLNFKLCVKVIARICNQFLNNPNEIIAQKYATNLTRNLLTFTSRFKLNYYENEFKLIFNKTN